MIRRMGGAAAPMSQTAGTGCSITATSTRDRRHQEQYQHRHRHRRKHEDGSGHQAAPQRWSRRRRQRLVVVVVVVAAVTASGALAVLCWVGQQRRGTKEYLSAVLDDMIDASYCWDLRPPPTQPEPETKSGNGTGGRKRSPLSGIVTTLLYGGKQNPQLLSSVCHLFPSQLTHFIVPQRLDVLMVVAGIIHVNDLVECLGLTAVAGAEAGGNHGNATSTTTTTTWDNLDGSTLTTVEYSALTVIGGVPYRTKILLARTDVEVPSYLREQIGGNKSRNWNRSNNNNSNTDGDAPADGGDDDAFLAAAVERAIEPPSCRAPIEYIQGTRWYTKEMLHLRLLRRYTFWIKLDPDVVFVRPLTFDLLFDMDRKHALLGHTGAYPLPPPSSAASASRWNGGNDHDDDDDDAMACSMGIADAVRDFVTRPGAAAAAAGPDGGSNNATAPAPQPRGGVCRYHPTMVRDRDGYYTNLLIGRTDFWQSRGVLELGRWLTEDCRDGFFKHRWTDQIFFHTALDLFTTGTAATTTVRQQQQQQQQQQQRRMRHQQRQKQEGPTATEVMTVADYTNQRCFPLTNCWMSALSLKDFAPPPTALSSSSTSSVEDVTCTNGGTFVHTKHAKRWVHRWNRHLARKALPVSNNATGGRHNQQRDGGAALFYDRKSQLPYREDYIHDCRGTRWE